MGCNNSIKTKEENLNKKPREVKQTEKKKLSTKESNNLITLQFKSDDSLINQLLSCKQNDIFKNIAIKSKTKI